MPVAVPVPDGFSAAKAAPLKAKVPATKIIVGFIGHSLVSVTDVSGT
jgi:hypothetical protein